MHTFMYKQSSAYHTMFVKHTKRGITVLIIYVDDMVATGDDLEEISKLKHQLATKFGIKDIRKLRYFLGIEVARSNAGIFISLRKYILDLLEETGMLGCRPTDTPIEANHRMGDTEGAPVDLERYQRLVGKLIYLSHTWPDIGYAASVLSQFMHKPRTGHLEAMFRVLRYLKSSPGKGVLFTNNGH